MNSVRDLYNQYTYSDAVTPVNKRGTIPYITSKFKHY